MINHILRGLRIGGIAILLLLGIGARAADELVVVVQNNSGMLASDLHVTFTGTGGNVFVSPLSVVAIPCPVPVIPSNLQVTNTVNIDWGVPCVMPGAFVMFVVRTTNGPLTVNSGFWTVGGVSVGGFGNVRAFRVPPPPPPPPPPPLRFWAKAVEVRCIPLGRSFYSPWSRPPGQTCWSRKKTMAPILYQTRIVRCLFVVRKGRIIDTGICIPLSNWTISHISPPSCEWEYATIMPPDLGGHEILPEGPVRRILQRPGKFGNWMFGQEIRSSNDTGQNYYRGANLATAFSDVAAALSTRFMGELNIHSFSDILLFLAPRYANAATALDGIIAELDASRLEEPDPDLDVLRNEFANLKSAFQQIATQFGSGISTDPLMFDQARGALQNIATIVQNQSPVSRFQHASEHIMRLADGYRLCRDMVIAGLESTPNQDNFLAGILNRVEDATTHIAASISAHVQLRLLPSSPRGWLPNMLDGAEVFIEDADTGEDLDSTLLPVSGIGTIEIPISWIGLNRHVRIGVKLDTYLSTSFDVLTTDGLTLSGPLVNGDVDGNDQIDTADLAFVNSHLGEGGLDVPEISEADINYSGRVDFDDLNQVAGNMGQIGTGHRSIEGTVILQDWDGALQGQEVHVELLSPSGVVVLDDKTAMIAEDGKYSVQTFRTGLVQVRVSRTGFLARKIDAVIGPGSVSGLLTSLINGDCMPDNEINLADYSALALAFLSVPGDANWNGSADLNGDGEVNLADYAILSRNFGLEGD